MRTYPKFLFFSHLAFYPIHWQAFEFIRNHYPVVCSVIARSTINVPDVHRQLGIINTDQIRVQDIDIRIIPDTNRISQAMWIFEQLQDIRPDLIWAQEEPDSQLLFLLLARYFFERKPRIAGAVCENIFFPKPFPMNIFNRFLWGRMDILMGTAKASIEGIQAVGFPKRIETVSLVAGALLPPAEIEPLPLPFDRNENDFVIAFVGRICQEKGWKILLEALKFLPKNYKCIMAGNGPQETELRETINQAYYKNRVYYFGLIPHEELWRFYKAADCLVLPSLTTPRWKEQFGGVLADAMAIGLPLVGSDSGSIPEVIGPAGLIASEGKPLELAYALRRLAEDGVLRTKLSQISQQRYNEEFSISLYARKIAQSLGIFPGQENKDSPQKM
jgi:glycosyltransferase involved in cell wall biosynthesis